MQNPTSRKRLEMGHEEGITLMPSSPANPGKPLLPLAPWRTEPRELVRRPTNQFLPLEAEQFELSFEKIMCSVDLSSQCKTMILKCK